MRKLLFVVVVVFLSATSVKAQSLSLGVNAGLPTGDYGDFTSFQFGGDIAYRYGVAGLVEVGPLVGYSTFLGENAEDADINFIPLAASGRVGLPMFFVGLDLGYALGLTDVNNGGLYYRPQVGFNFLMLGLIASYQEIRIDGGPISSINLGVELGF